jgi:5'-methylthioadenosine phosphorylase
MKNMGITTGFITGTGFYQLPNVNDVHTETIQTPYGEVGVEIGIWQDQEIAFIPRHGKGHTIAPSMINYRANLYAFHMLGTERIFSTSVCGSLVSDWGAGSMVLVDQFLNFSSGREDSFYPMNGLLAHIDVTDPYCPSLHSLLIQAAQLLNIPLIQGATYACFSGPRFESRAEIEMVRRLGGQLVGMTNYPECVLARELEICYATVGVVSNQAAGGSSLLRADDLSDSIEPVVANIPMLFAEAIKMLPEHLNCSCRRALDGAFIGPN